jgi:hypothetical protein
MIASTRVMGDMRRMSDQMKSDQIGSDRMVVVWLMLSHQIKLMLQASKMPAAAHTSNHATTPARLEKHSMVRPRCRRHTVGSSHCVCGPVGVGGRVWISG